MSPTHTDCVSVCERWTCCAGKRGLSPAALPIYPFQPREVCNIWRDRRHPAPSKAAPSRFSACMRASMCAHSCANVRLCVCTRVSPVCVCVCVCVCVSASCGACAQCVCARARACASPHGCARVCVHMSARAHVCVRSCVYTQACARVRARMRACAHACELRKSMSNYMRVRLPRARVYRVHILCERVLYGPFVPFCPSCARARACVRLIVRMCLIRVAARATRINAAAVNEYLQLYKVALQTVNPKLQITEQRLLRSLPTPISTEPDTDCKSAFACKLWCNVSSLLIPSKTDNTNLMAKYINLNIKGLKKVDF